MRKTFLSIGCAAAFATVLSSFKIAGMNDKHHYLLVGTYTSGNTSGGIYVYDFDDKTGVLTAVSHTENVVNPSYLALTKDEKYLYSVNENLDNTTQGMVSAFGFNNEKGVISLLNTVPSNGDAPCFTAVDKTNKNVTVANYSGGNFSVYKTDETGRLLPATQIIAHTGTSANTKIQTQPHVHSTIFSPDEKYLFVCDLGNDTLYQYPYNASNAKPVDESRAIKYKIPAGFGPRHIVFSPDHKFVYLLSELDAKIIAYSFHDDTLEYLQTVTSTDAQSDADGDIGAAAIRISPNGKFLYSSNRGNANDIAIFKINDNGTLASVAHVKTGKHPRDFNISADGNFLVVACRDENSVKVYKINASTGMIDYTGYSANLPKPVCLVFGAKK